MKNVKKRYLSPQEKVVQVLSTLAIENMYMDERAKRNLVLIATKQKTSTEIIAELNSRYAVR